MQVTVVVKSLNGHSQLATLLCCEGWRVGLRIACLFHCMVGLWRWVCSPIGCSSRTDGFTTVSNIHKLLEKSPRLLLILPMFYALTNPTGGFDQQDGVRIVGRMVTPSPGTNKIKRLSLGINIYNIYIFRYTNTTYICPYVLSYVLLMLMECKFIYLYKSIYLSIYLSIHPPIYLSIYLSIHPSINLFIYLSIHLSTYLSINRSYLILSYLLYLINLSIYLSNLI